MEQIRREIKGGTREKEIKPKIKLSETHKLKEILRIFKLTTICEEGFCPNISECFGKLKTATFLIGGEFCTRGCRYCGVKKMKNPPPPPPDEPERIAMAVKLLNLKYVVITSVTRDDLSDEGAHHFAKCIEEIRKNSNAIIEALVPDFKEKNLEIIFSERPNVLSHNIEVVQSLYGKIRKANYLYSLKILEIASKKKFITKTSLILGIGETKEEVFATIKDISQTGCSILTLGQYLPPSIFHAEIKRIISDEEFEEYKSFALSCGIKVVFAGHNVRSSYLAEKMVQSIK